MVPSAQPRRHFLPWDRPLLPQAAAWLARDWTGAGPLDLGRQWVIVPTRQSGRRLREMLAERAAEHGQAVLAPRVITPEMLLRPVRAEAVASRLESLLTWAELLRRIDLADYRDVFPVDPPARSFPWAFALARRLLTVQEVLADGRMDFSTVAPGAGDFPEVDRWRQLADLEARYAAALAADGRRSESAARIAAGMDPPLLEGDRVVVLATPDPSPLVVTALEAHARRGPVDVVIFAPAEEAENFDAWGRPVQRAWVQRELVLPDFARHVHLCFDPTAQAERIAGLAQAYEAPDGWLAVGVADAEVLPELEGALTLAGIASFDPAGRPRRREGLYDLLAALVEFVRDPSYEAVERVARCPEVLGHLREAAGATFSPARFLAGLDEMRARHLPADLGAARARTGDLSRYPELPAGLAGLAALRAALEAEDYFGAMAATLARLFATHQAIPERAEVERLAAAALEWSELLRVCRLASERFAGISRAEWWDVALQLFGETVQIEEKPAGALELQGWLEMLWEDAPHAAIAGLNDGRVPEAVTEDAFLPGSLRERLGLRTNADRLARDAYLLQALVACRASEGRVDLYFGKTSAVGEPLRPSRLLLRCDDGVLPERVAFLFRSPELGHPGLAWARAWQLNPPRRAAPAKVAVTALRDYLRCPFRFYLRRVLGMAAVDPRKNELDALDFGILCHAALEALGRDPVMCDATDAALLRDFLLAQLEQSVAARYGADLSVPLLIQTESARQRLAHAAEVQAAERAAGWRIEEVEKNFTLEASGVVIAGKIDRLERHEATGLWRVLDYKTSDQAAHPRDKHLRLRRSAEDAPDWATFDDGGKARVWSDLQLPMYLRAVAGQTGGGPVDCGYFNLPKAVGDTGLSIWADATPAVQESAWRCAEGVCAAIRGGIFWPPRELSQRDAELDPFADLFHHGAAESVAWREGP